MSGSAFFFLYARRQSPIISYSTEFTETQARAHIESTLLTSKYISAFSFIFAYDSTEIVIEEYSFNQTIFTSSIEASKIDKDTARIAIATTGVYQGSGRLLTIDSKLLSKESPTLNVVAIIADGITRNDISFADTLIKNQTIELYETSTSLEPSPDTSFSSLPITYHKSYPNPFNPTTTVEYSLSEASEVQFTIYNSLGREVHSLPSTNRSAGVHSVTFDGGTIPSCVYYYVLNVDSYKEVGSLVVAK